METRSKKATRHTDIALALGEPSATHRPTPPEAAVVLESPNPQDEINIPIPGASHSSRSGHSSHRSGSTVLARKLAVEAELRRRQLDRERELEKKRREVEEIELKATLAAMDSGSVSSAASRTRAWVQDVAIQSSIHQSPFPQVILPPVTAAPLTNSKDVQATLPLQIATPLNKEVHTMPPENQHISTVVGQLATAITSLTESKRTILPTFSGNFNEWLPFYNTFRKTECNFSPIANVSRLGDALRGPAREAVETLLHTSKDPGDIITTLQRMFARPELIVAHEVAALRSLPKVTSHVLLSSLANKLHNCLAKIKALKQHEIMSSPEIYRNVLSKLSELTKARFVDYASDREDGSTKIELLSVFLLQEADKQLKFTYVPDFSNPPQYSAHVPKRDFVHSTSALKEPIQTKKCAHCSGTHTITTCNEFRLLTVENRWLRIRELKVCFRCLKGGAHRWNYCRSKRCGVDGCVRRHHALLHGNTGGRSSSGVDTSLHANTNVDRRAPVTPDELSRDEVTVSNVEVAKPPNPLTPRPCSRALLRVVPVIVRGPRERELATFALLDDGSTATLIDADVASKIGATDEFRQPIRIGGVGGMCRDTCVGYTSFYIRGLNETDEYLIENARSVSNLSIQPQTITRETVQTYKHLEMLMENLLLDDATPMILIGACDWHLTISRETHYGKPSEPVATRTLLGWTLHGLASSKTKQVDFVNHAVETELDPIESILKEQYRLDSIGISKLPPKNSQEDQRAIDIVEATARRLSSGRFEVGLPWHHACPIHVPDSYPQALSRFRSLEKQMKNNADFAQSYNTFVTSVLEKGYAEECPSNSYYRKSSPADRDHFRWYLPHFGVYHPQKKKIRVVHDAAAVTKGTSLNSLLLTGPDLLQPLLAIIFRFREGRIAVTGDIKEMFPQIRIRASDRDAQRFLWRSHSSNAHYPPPIKEYRMTSMIFGAVSSPFMALYLKNKNALDFQASYPEATQEIIDNHYMDDYIASFNHLHVATKVINDVFTVHKACCFEMRSWVSNDARVLVSFPKELRANPDSEVVLPTEVTALGIKWNPANDTLGFRIGNLELSTETKLTKRMILSRVMQVYDPLGLITPVVIKGRILIQDLWREGLGWDDTIPSRFADVWKDWVNELNFLKDTHIPRWYLASDLEPSNIQLHMFADASELAYACVGYWRFQLQNGQCKLCLIGSKARVAPLKPCSIPRLELQAALIAARFAKTITDSHRLKPSATFFWTDSTTVVKWLRGDARRYKSFVAHRVGEIQELTDSRDWKWLPSNLNVADDATRLNPFGRRWFTGPPFLLTSPKEWPFECASLEVAPLPDMREVVGFLTNAAPQGTESCKRLEAVVPNPERFSVWLRLLRATAYVILGARKFRLLLGKPIDQNSKLFCNTVSSTVTVEDMATAENLLLTKAQSDAFGKEIALIKNSKPLPKSSRLFSIAMSLQEDGLLTMVSRIKMLPDEDATLKTRILLDDRHWVVRLLIAHHHAKAGHAFHEVVLNNMRERFWILRHRKAIKRAAGECQECRRRKRKPQQPPLGDLPLERLDHHTRPFTHVGLDYFGPIVVSIRRRQEKRWVALYSCLVTRALHIEVVNSLSTDSALLSLRRMIARRGCPRTITSDNATAFVGASKELSRLFGKSVEDFAVNNFIKWNFVPPASPFMAGATERMVRTVKTALKATLKEQSPKEEILVTFLLEAEALCNSRPLTYVPIAVDAPQAITPFDFILGSSSTNQWHTGQDDSVLARQPQLKLAQRLTDLFWSRWVREYLPTMIKRPPSNESARTLQVGDVVVIADPTLPRGLWPLGRITRVYPGADGVVRVADVGTKGGTLKRPVRKLVPLVVTDQAATST